MSTNNANNNDIKDSVGTSLVITHTSVENDDLAVEIIADAAGFGGAKALDIDFITGAQSVGNEDAAIVINIDDTLATGGEVYGMEVLVTPGASTITAMRAGALVNPLEQLSGTFADADTILNKAVDVAAALANGGAGSITTFVADNDTFTIGDAAKFEELSFDLATSASGAGIGATFEYSDGVGSWVSFGPTDGTNNMKNTGVIAWNTADVPTWAVGTGTEYLIRITRTRNNLGTTPVMDEVQKAAVVEYGWDKDAKITVDKAEIKTAVVDANDNELVLFGTTASAVNEITVTNAATAGNPSISTTGDDANIDLTISPKGTGDLGINSSVFIGTNVSGNSTLGISIGKIGSAGGTVDNRLTLGAYGAVYGSYIESYSDFSASTASYLAMGTQPGGGGAQAEHLRIDDAGKVGIGITTPSSALDVIGGIETSTGVSTGISGTSSATNTYNTVFSNVTEYKITKSIYGSTAINLLQLTFPALTLFCSIKCRVTMSKAPGINIGTSVIKELNFSVGRNGSGSDVILDALTGLDTSVTTTSAGGGGNVLTAASTIVRNGAEANTAPQVVNITLNPATTGPSSSFAIARIDIMYMGTTTDFSFT